MNLWFLIFLIIFIALKIECSKVRANFDEIFGNAWDNNEREEMEMKIEQNEQNENSPNGQIGEKNGTDSISEQKREIIKKFQEIKVKLREKGKLPRGENNTKIERKIGKLLGANRQKIYKWKKELNLNKMKKSFYDQKKNEFIERFDAFKSLYGQRKQKEFAKELGIGETTFRKWKKELVPKYLKIQNHYSNEEKTKKTKQYFKIKENNPKISDKIIAKNLGIGFSTLQKLKKAFFSN